MSQVATQVKKPDFPELRTTTGHIYTNCFVRKVEPDALTIRHSKGMARISFFALSSKIQSQYDFDPIAAAKKASVDEKTRRETKWKLFWHNQEYESEKSKQAAADKLYLKAKKTWIPIEATILEYKHGGAYISARRIVMVPTKTKSTLGFIKNGPPKKAFVPLNPGLIFIENPHAKIIACYGSKWEGYIESFSTKKVPSPSTGRVTIEVRRAVPRAK